MANNENDSKLSLLLETRAFFSEVVTTAVEKRRLETTPLVCQYLVELLDSYVPSNNLEMNKTLAEQLLLANQAERVVKRDMLKRLGDSSLYISGFFGDSLNRKIVDIDYYADIGGIAYGMLSKELADDVKAQVYGEFASRFLDYVDLLTYISQNFGVASNQDLLRLYERYVKTGSEVAKEGLLERGLLNAEQAKKASNQ